MALYTGEEMVDVTGADGRSLRVPKSVAAAMQLPQPVMPTVQPPAPVELPTAPPVAPMAPEDTETLEQATAQVNAAPVTAPPPAPEPAAPKQAKPRAPAPPQQQGTTAQDLRQAGLGGALDVQVAANNQVADAVVQESDIKAAGQVMIGNELAERDKQIDALLVKRAEDAKQGLQAESAKIAEAETIKKKIAGTKIDRTLDHPILAAISMAMTGLGMALTKQGAAANPAIDIVWKALDRKVAGQMSDLDQLRTVYGMTKDEVKDIREKWSNRLAVNNMLVAAEGEKAARHIETMTARSSSDLLKAEGQRLVAEIRTRTAALTADAIKTQLAADADAKKHRDEMGFKWGSLKQADRHHKDDLQFKREQLYADELKFLAQERARKGEAAMKEAAALQKDNQALGVSNVATGERLLNKQGMQMVQQAQKLTEEAAQIRASQGPLTQGQAARAAALEDKAAVLRGEAQLRHTFKHRDPTQAGVLSQKYSSAQSVTTLIDEIKILYDTHGRAYFSTEAGQAAIQAKTTEILMGLKNAWQLGVLSKADIEVVNRATGGDLTKGFDAGNLAHSIGIKAGTDPEAFKARLDSIAGGLEKSIYNDLRITGWDGTAKDLFVRKTAAPAAGADKIDAASKAVLQDKTPREVGAGATKGLAEPLLYPLGGGPADQDKKYAEEGGSVRYPGLSEKQATHTDQLIRAAKGGNKKAINNLISQATSDREELSYATLKAMKQEGLIDVYWQAFQKLPTTRKAQPKPKAGGMAGVVEVASSAAEPQPTVYERLLAEDQARGAVQRVRGDVDLAKASARDIVMSGEHNMRLGQLSVAGDRAAIAELGKRVANGDAEAKTVLQNVLQRQGSR